MLNSITIRTDKHTKLQQQLGSNATNVILMKGCWQWRKVSDIQMNVTGDIMLNVVHKKHEWETNLALSGEKTDKPYITYWIPTQFINCLYLNYLPVSTLIWHASHWIVWKTFWIDDNTFKTNVKVAWPKSEFFLGKNEKGKKLWCVGINWPEVSHERDI